MQLIVGIDQRIEVMGSMFFKRVVELKLAADKFTWRRQSDRGRHPAPGHVIAVAGVEVPVVAVGVAFDRRVALWCDRAAEAYHFDDNFRDAAGVERQTAELANQRGELVGLCR